jgi:hypothetical protein
MLGEKKSSFSPQNTVLDISKSPSETSSSPPVFLDTGNDDPDDKRTFQGQVSTP